MLDHYKQAHAAAMRTPRHGFEAAIVGMFRSLREYAAAHEKAYGSPIGDDCVLGDHWLELARALLGLLNGETGRLDCGTLDREIRMCAKAARISADL